MASYDGKIMSEAVAEFEQDKQRRHERFLQQQKNIYLKIPRLAEIEKQLRSTLAQVIARAIRMGIDPMPEIKVIMDNNLELQRERAELLVAAGYPMDYLEEAPKCKKCKDTGYVDSGVCTCLQEYYKRHQIKELSKMLDIGNNTFENFDFGWYSSAIDPEVGNSPRTNMEQVFDICQDYAHQFGEHSDNLLLCGDPGLGKTFLSTCIAKVVSENNFSVVYDSATHIFSVFERAKFRNEYDEQAETELKRFLKCDLLIIDDLGTELTTSFVQSAFYQVVNERLINNKKTIISTNLYPDAIGKKYSVQIRSRLEGEYRILPFFGEDIRRQKRYR